MNVSLKRIVFVALLMLAGCGSDKDSDIEKAADKLGSAIVIAALMRALFNK